ncbi:hypothetical protein Tcan_13879 [Toxocara canis]|uniref:Uncharacterized protein n=1 Tax=Toxocara canis TaxID=6265 RepID=A0A0B2V688_TOXCA|nr:hypothetical protein Tcan_13879 [Toxocara canis]
MQSVVSKAGEPMRTHPAAPSGSSQRNATWEETISRRTTGRATKKKPSAVEMPAEIKSPGGSSRRTRRAGTGAGSTSFSSPTNSPEICMIDEGGPAKRTRLSERTASECSPGAAPEPPKLRRSPRVHDSVEPSEVWRSPRRRGASGFISPHIKEEPIVVGIDDVQSTAGGSRNELTVPIVAEQSSPPLESLLGDTDDIHRREGSTETMAMCEESSDRSIFDGENDESGQLIEELSLVRHSTSKSAKEVTGFFSAPTRVRTVIAAKVEEAVAQSSGKRTSSKSKAKLSRSTGKLTAVEQPVVPRKRRLEQNITTDVPLVSQNAIEPLKGRLLMALRELIDGAKLFATQARRERLTASDVDAFMRHAHHPRLYGFMEDDSWLKIGDVFVPNEKPLQLTSLPGSIKQSDLPRTLPTKKKGSRRGVARTRDAPLESIPPLKHVPSEQRMEIVVPDDEPIPPLKHVPSEQRMEIVVPDDEPVELSSDMLYNFAQSMPVPLSRSDFWNENAIEPLKGRLLMALRELIDGAKLFATQARRERLTASDVDAFMRHAHHPVG